LTAVKVGVLQFFSWPERRVPLRTVYDRALDRIALMDRTGYDAVWLAEHHFSGYSVCPSVHLMGMAVAERTERLRVGMAVTLAAFYHPLRVAEEVALLDVLSGGRVNWGAGRGFDRTEHDVFGVGAEDSYPRFREHVDIVLAAWRNERLTYHGQYWDFDDVEVLPRPLQVPHPPVWAGVSSPDAITWAAGQGLSILMDPHSSIAEITTKRRLWHDALSAAGHSPQGRETPIARLVAIGATRSEAEEVARRGASWMVGSYVGARPAIHARDGPRRPADPVARYLDQVIIWGTAAEVVDRLDALREAVPMTYLMAAPLSHGSFLALTDEVLPKLV
jgi:alkanesulfonate monooxygenase SsuD/methylene tetrahydromethanopterin reductase-like flavin-dependent oxidoreductase (luciferase family)